MTHDLGTEGACLPARLGLGIFLASFAILLVELLLTRILSVTMFHHFSFLAVSVAMTGLGLSGLAVTLFPERFSAERLPRICGQAALAFAITTVVVIGIAFQIPVRLEMSTANAFNTLFVFLISVVPFLAGGLVISMILTHHSRAASQLYGMDLLGAAAACLLYVPATNLLGAPTAVMVGAAIAAVAGVALVGSENEDVRGGCRIAAAVLVAAAVLNTQVPFFDVRVAKGREQPPNLVTLWNSFSRVEVNGTESTMGMERRPLSFGYSARIGTTAVRELYLRYDADALTQIPAFAGDLAAVGYLGLDVTSAPYQMRQNGDVLVIGAGGGRDILTALTLGSGPVVGVEVNPLTIALMKGRFADYSGDLYNGYPGVEIVRDDGRSFVRHTERRFDVIQASLVDTWAASSAGAYALAENSLYTVDAFEDYLDRLNPGGVVSFSRWYDEPPVEVLRVAALATEALRRGGVTNPSAHLVVLRTRSELTGFPSLATVLMRRDPFPPEELAALRTWADEMEFAVSYMPGYRGAFAESAFDALLGPDAAEFLRQVPYDLSIVTDERPFFFDRVPLLAWLRTRLGLPAPAAGRGELTLGGQTLLAALATTGLFTLLLVIGPFFGSRGRRMAEGERARALRWVGYFVGLGFGYIMVEIVLIQRLNLYLGNPAYALSVVLFTMLSASGLGALASARVGRRWPLPAILVSVALALVGYHLLLPATLDATLGGPMSTRVLVAVATTAPVAFLMGMPFPLGLERAGRESERVAAWGWAVNAGASVSGSVIAVLLSMSYGFGATMIGGILAYALSSGMAFGLPTPAAPQVAEVAA